jgi:hypothetical protein
LPALDVTSIIAAHFGATNLTANAAKGGVEFLLPPAAGATELHVWFKPVAGTIVPPDNTKLDNANRCT